MDNKIVGDKIKIYEYPNAAIIDNTDEEGGSISVQSPKDALLIIESLSRFLLAHPYFKNEKYKD